MDKTVVIWLVVGVLILTLTILIFAFIWVRNRYAKRDTERFLAATSGLPKPYTKEQSETSEAMRKFYTSVHQFGKQKVADPNALDDPKLRENMESILSSYTQAHGERFDPDLYSRHLRNFKQYLPAKHYQVLEGLSPTLQDIFRND